MTDLARTDAVTEPTVTIVLTRGQVDRMLAIVVRHARHEWSNDLVNGDAEGTPETREALELVRALKAARAATEASDA